MNSYTCSLNSKTENSVLSSTLSCLSYSVYARNSVCVQIPIYLCISPYYAFIVRHWFK